MEGYLSSPLPLPALFLFLFRFLLPTTFTHTHKARRLTILRCHIPFLHAALVKLKRVDLILTLTFYCCLYISFCLNVQTKHICPITNEANQKVTMIWIMELFSASCHWLQSYITTFIVFKRRVRALSIITKAILFRVIDNCAACYNFAYLLHSIEPFTMYTLSLVKNLLPILH